MKAAAWILAMILCCAALQSRAETPDGPIRDFHDAEAVVFLGDSITHNGHFHSFVHLYEVTRHPHRTVTFHNAGVSGGKAKNALTQLDWDVIAHDPGHIFIMLGMNDAGTSHFLSMSGEELKAENAALLERYRDEMTEIVSRIRTALPDCEIVLCSSSMYDQTGPQERVPSVGKNDAILSQIPVLRAIAEAYDCRFVDFTNPMMDIDAREKARDPDFTIVGPDRTHPGPLGHMVMAWQILRRFEPLPPVSAIAIDYTDASVVGATNATVESARRQGDSLAFTVTAGALPYHFDPEHPAPGVPSAADALALLPGVSALSTETLRVLNSGGGKWELLIDGSPIGVYTAAELEAGINLGLNTNTPGAAQARHVAEINTQRWNAERTWRGIQWVRVRVAATLGIEWSDRDAVMKAVGEWPTNPAYAESHQKYLDLYMENRDREAEIIAEIQRLTREMRHAARPAPHGWMLRPLAAE